jgi:L1 cell adhesion molecule like protein
MNTDNGLDDGLVIGIDLGTTNSCVSIHHFGRSEVIANDLGSRTTPSVVYIGPTPAEILVGAPAKQMSANSPQCTVFGAKRMIGRRFNDPIIQDDIKLWPYTVVQQDGFPLIQMEHDGIIKYYTPEEISGFILFKMRKIAEDFLGTNITKAVITVPANFNSLQRNATKVAAQHAGLMVPKILNEPTAAAFAYGYQSKERGKDKQHILIYDFGGGTLDVSIVVADNGIFQVLGTDGDTHLGGEDFDNVLVDYCLQQFQKQTGLDPSGNSRVLRKLRGECEKAKCSLSALNKTFVEVSFKGEEMVIEITRALFERITKKQFESCIAPVHSLLTRLQLTESIIDEIILVGGTTRIPKIQATILNSFKKFQSGEKTLCKTVNADEVVAVGASLQAAVLSKSTFQQTTGIEIIDVVPLFLGLQTRDQQFRPILSRNAVLPAAASIEIPLTQLYLTPNGSHLILLEGEDNDINKTYLLDHLNISRILQTNTNPNLVLKIELKMDKHGNLSLSVIPFQSNQDTNGIYAYFDGSKLVYHKYGDKQSKTDPNAPANTHSLASIPSTMAQAPLALHNNDDLFDDELFGEMLCFSPVGHNSNHSFDENPLLLSRLDSNPNQSFITSLSSPPSTNHATVGSDISLVQAPIDQTSTFLTSSSINSTTTPPLDNSLAQTTSPIAPTQLPHSNASGALNVPNTKIMLNDDLDDLFDDFLDQQQPAPPGPTTQDFSIPAQPTPAHAISHQHVSALPVQTLATPVTLPPALPTAPPQPQLANTSQYVNDDDFDDTLDFLVDEMAISTDSNLAQQNSIYDQYPTLAQSQAYPSYQQHYVYPPPQSLHHSYQNDQPPPQQSLSEQPQPVKATSTEKKDKKSKKRDAPAARPFMAWQQQSTDNRP